MKHLSFSLLACFQRQVKIISISSFCSLSFWLVKEEQQLLSMSALSTIIDSVQILTYWSVEQYTSMCRQLGRQQTVHFLSSAVNFFKRKLPKGVSSSEQNILCSSWMELHISVKLLNLFLKLCVLPRVYSSNPPLVTSGQLAKSLSTQLICLQLTYFSLMQLRISQWNSAQKLKNISELLRQQLLRICSVIDSSRPWSMRTLWILSLRCVRICSMKRNSFFSDQSSFALLCCITSVMPSSSFAVCTLKNFFRALPYLAETQVAEVIFWIVPVISFQGQANTFPIPSTIFSILNEVFSRDRYSTFNFGMTVIEFCSSRSSNSFSIPPSKKMMLTLTLWQKEMILFISLSLLFIMFSKEASFSPPTRSSDSMLPYTRMQVMFSYSSLMRLLVKAFLISTMGSRARLNSSPQKPLILTFWQTFILPVTTKLGGILLRISQAMALSCGRYWSGICDCLSITCISAPNRILISCSNFFMPLISLPEYSSIMASISFNLSSSVWLVLRDCCWISSMLLGSSLTVSWSPDLRCSMQLSSCLAMYFQHFWMQASHILMDFSFSPRSLPEREKSEQLRQWARVPCAEYLAAVSTVMFAPVEGVELLIALEAVDRIIVLDPLLLGAE